MLMKRRNEHPTVNYRPSFHNNFMLRRKYISTLRSQNRMGQVDKVKASHTGFYTDIMFLSSIWHNNWMAVECRMILIR